MWRCHTGNLQPALMHESRGLKRLSRFLIGHPDGGELAQFSIDQRKQLVGGFRIARINGVEQLRDVGQGKDGRCSGGLKLALRSWRAFDTPPRTLRNPIYAP
jgi:hypothetical protein